MAIAPRDLAVRWDHDGFTCQIRPYVRTTSVAGIRWVGPSAAFLFLFVSAVLGAGLVALWVLYVLTSWYGERRRVDQVQQIRLTRHTLEVTRTRSEAEVYRAVVPLRTVGLVTATQRLGAFEVVVRRAGEDDLAIPVNSESQMAGAWLATTIQTAAKLSRERDGDGAGEVPDSLRALLEGAR